ncbi:hypothetical protein EV207_1608 [Scopulibacillus darangshiensis]|uniref:LSM domain-containing protein n=1 Tax=Scopulibacillus darangshiensis TaxID=442528 RepID=A0A4R2NEZ3_9BACL|nr:hypothetical protein [Scopulibacillus darangshiensis]TCP19702.1 hypothetical protein EV207_1608 [Scopulibacillus darangshiensis]
MPKKSHYEFCRDNIGNAIEIEDHDGQRYYGIIRSVDDENVYLDPPQEMDWGSSTGHGSYLFGYPFFRPFFPFRGIGFARPFPFFW